MALKGDYHSLFPYFTFPFVAMPLDLNVPGTVLVTSPIYNGFYEHLFYVEANKGILFKLKSSDFMLKNFNMDVCFVWKVLESYQKLMSAFADNEELPTKIAWERMPDGSLSREIIRAQDGRVSIPMLTAYYQTLIKRANYVLNTDLLRNQRIPVLTLKNLAEDASISEPGFSFINCRSNVQNFGVFSKIVTGKIHTALTTTGAQSDKIKKWLEKCDELRELILVMIYMYSGSPVRATDLLRLRTINGANTLRNLTLLYDTVAIILRQTKHTKQIGFEDQQARFLTQEASEIIAIFLFIVSPLER